jgi:hypothetical protein
MRREPGNRMVSPGVLINASVAGSAEQHDRIEEVLVAVAGGKTTYIAVGFCDRHRAYAGLGYRGGRSTSKNPHKCWTF